MTVVEPARRPRLRRPLVVGTALVSLLTMPITAIWFLLLAPIVAVVGAVLATAVRSHGGKERILVTAASVAVGLLAGPLVYLGLALIT